MGEFIPFPYTRKRSLSSAAKAADDVVANLEGARRNRLTPLCCGHAYELAVRPVCSINSRTNPIFRRRLRLSRICAIVFGRRRVQFVPAAVPGTLNRSLRARTSVIITIAIQELLWNSARIIAG